MSEFNVLYRSLHRNKVDTKAVEKKTAEEPKKDSQPEAPMGFFRTLISKIF